VALLLQHALTLDELQQDPGDLLVILRRNLLDQTDVMLQHLQLTIQLDDLADPRVSRVVIAHEKMACRDVVVVFALTTLAVMALSGMGDLMDPESHASLDFNIISYSNSLPKNFVLCLQPPTVGKASLKPTGFAIGSIDPNSV
jgi:hypothetical protein